MDLDNSDRVYNYSWKLSFFSLRQAYNIEQGCKQCLSEMIPKIRYKTLHNNNYNYNSPPMYTSGSVQLKVEELVVALNVYVSNSGLRAGPTVTALYTL